MKIKTLFLFLFLTFFSTFSYAATLHSFLIFDTSPEDIGKSVSIDLQNIRNFLRDVSHNTNLTLNEKIFSEKEYNRAIFQEIAKTSIKSDDLVFFYFGGHGFHSPENPSNWPNFVLMPTRNYLAFEEIAAAIEEKKPRLIIIASDCCNNISAIKIPKIMKARNFNFDIHENFKKLFLNIKGKIYISASSVGEFSAGNNLIGGFFTHHFISNIYSEIFDEDNPSWDNIVENTRWDLEQFLFLNQTPYAEINIKAIR